MGNNLIIEFVGLPGSGKSYLSHKLANELKDKGLLVSEPSFFLDHVLLKPLRLMNKLGLSFLFVVIHPKKYLAIKEIVRRNGYGSFKSFHKQCVNLIIKIQQFSRKTDKVRIFDEGLIQAAVSLSINDNYSINKNIIFLAEQLSNYKSLVFYVNTDVNVCLQRMSSRKTNDSRIERLPDDDRKEYAMKIKKILDSIECQQYVMASEYDDIRINAENYISAID